MKNSFGKPYFAETCFLAFSHRKPMIPNAFRLKQGVGFLQIPEKFSRGGMGGGATLLITTANKEAACEN